MEICHPHNLNDDLTRDKPFGIRVSLPAGDSFLSVIGADWHREHWFESPRERDDALKRMHDEHLYSRPGDRPSLVFVSLDPDDAEAN
jgi:hypothetical protein